MTWILIIMMSGNAHPAAVDHVSGFWSEAQCRKAGEAARTARPDPGNVFVNYVCVRQGPEGK